MRQSWDPVTYCVGGRLRAAHKHSLLNVMLLSYSEMGSFPQSNRSRGVQTRRVTPVTCVDFDAQGVHVASVSSRGCLSIHDFDTLYCTSGVGCEADNVIPTIHVQTRPKLAAVRWNPNNQDEVACMASESSDVYLYDLANRSQFPSETLCYNPTTEAEESRGLRDVSYCTSDKDRVVACGTDRIVHIWDRRVGRLPRLSHHAPTGGGDFSSLQLLRDEHLVVVGDDNGCISLWDFRVSGEVFCPQLKQVNVATLLEGIDNFMPSRAIDNVPIDSISLNHLDGYNLGFHLHNGWSGALDLREFCITHIYCTRDLWQNDWRRGRGTEWLTSRRGRPCWLQSYPVFVVGCHDRRLVHFLDFTPGRKSPSSVHRLGLTNRVGEGERGKKQLQLQPSEPVVAIASHPTNDYLVAGTEAGSLLLIGQNKNSVLTEEGALRLTEQSGADHPTGVHRRITSEWSD